MSTLTIRDIPRTTPEAYKAMTPAQRRTFDRKHEKAMAALEAQTQKRRDEANEKMFAGIVALVGQSQYLEAEIVHQYCKRKGKLIVDKDMYTGTSPVSRIRKTNRG